ncbi:LYR motif-containing protein 4 [Penicillium rolfsii]|nr:LYR motif-containing protein 4 [Penicillium rolfsii]
MSVATMQRDTAFQVRSLFRSLMRQSSQFSNFNFRDYARRKTRDSFREHKNETEERRIQELIQDGLKNLRMLKRQTVISQFYQLDKLVVEGQQTGKETGDKGGIVRQKDTGASRSGRHLDTSNRSRTGQIDHDVFEGLPVRRWSRQPYTVSQAPKGEDSELGEGSGGSTALPELPMPRDSQLLPAMSRALLRAARAGCIYIRPSGRAVEKEKEEGTDGEDQAAASHLADRSFTSRKWTTLPKHMEPAEVEFLAKRRPGLTSLYGNEGGAIPGPMRKTKIKRTDPENGGISIYEVWVPEGHRIEGEITGDVQTIAEQSEVPVTAETPAPGTVVEGVGIVNAEGVVVAEAGSAAVMTPPKRRPPPPKRKGKGPGKGRKKKVMFAPGEGADAATVHGIGPADGAVDGVKEGEDPSRMSVDQSGQEDDEDDGEEGDESDDGDESMMDAKTPETPQAPPSNELVEQPAEETPAEQAKDVEMADAAPNTQTLVSETEIAVEESHLPPTMAPTMQTETFKTDAEASNAIPASATPTPAEETDALNEQPDQNASLETPAPPESVTPAVPSTAELAPAPKEESQAPEPVLGQEASQEPADATPVQVKSESTPQAAEEIVPAPASASPEKPEETPSEPPKESELEQPTSVAPIVEAEPIIEEAAQVSVEELRPTIEPAAGPDITEPQQSPAAFEAVPAPAEVEDIEMGDAPPAEEPAAAQPPVKEPSPSPGAPVEPEAKSEPELTPVQTAELPVPEAAAPEVSEAAVPEAAPLPKPQPEEPLAPLPTPNPETTPAPEPETTSAPESAPTEEPTSGTQDAAEEKKDDPVPEPKADPAPVPESS